MRGTIVIGEGERDEAPMLWIGEPVGTRGAGHVAIDIAVDPLEGTNLVAHGQANAITVLAASEAGGLLHAPDTYLEKLCVGPVAAGHVDIRASADRERARDRGRAPTRRRATSPSSSSSGRATTRSSRRSAATGARIKLITDGDLSAAISCAVSGTGVHAVMGIGGAPGGRPHGGRAALPGRRDPGALPVPQRRGARARRADGHRPPTRSASTTRPTWRRARTSSSRRPA